MREERNVKDRIMVLDRRACRRVLGAGILHLQPRRMIGRFMMPRSQQHFFRLASHYSGLRTTDEKPILYIKDYLKQKAGIVAADVGCGACRLLSIAPEGRCPVH